jgi:hypothetical protein
MQFHGGSWAVASKVMVHVLREEVILSSSVMFAMVARISKKRRV